MAKVLNYTKTADVDRGKGSVLFLKDIKPKVGGRRIYPDPAKNVYPNDEGRLKGVDAADHYLQFKQEYYKMTEEDIRRGIFASGLFIGMCAMTTLCWYLGYFNVG